ncbi:Uncharacterized membrane protein [Methanobrevibacter gottschalkii]|uniref:Uncharacterized membrane protein n=1 Tax=Methanobrevibacter gottschalkii TaxID=190974 RepID=A0A1H7LMY9_9EURY|nr:TMEM175 family protein [Methanobrevibacter gottschalkii]MCQ2970010.1 TMEM175 family protein [archaeon]SEL00334.1 Uncharacterized membrane protein [Methanobrevibacter gottschalkii]
MNEKYMSTNRLEAFYDAIIAIIVTILVLELPQPATTSIQSILALKTSYFAYLISFLVCTNLWQYHHLIYNHVEHINAKIIWQNIFLLLIVSLIPYLTTFVANNPFNLLAEVLYGLDFIIVNIILFWMAKSLLEVNSNQEYLSYALDVKNALVIPFILFITGLAIAFLGYPFSISICCLISVIRSIVYSIKY